MMKRRKTIISTITAPPCGSPLKTNFSILMTPFRDSQFLISSGPLAAGLSELAGALDEDISASGVSASAQMQERHQEVHLECIDPSQGYR